MARYCELVTKLFVRSLNAGALSCLGHAAECWNIRSQDYLFPGTFVPMMELSFSGPFVPWNIRFLDHLSPIPNITRKIHSLGYNRSNTSFIVYVK